MQWQKKSGGIKKCPSEVFRPGSEFHRAAGVAMRPCLSLILPICMPCVQGREEREWFGLPKSRMQIPTSSTWLSDLRQVTKAFPLCFTTRNVRLITPP